MAKAIVAQDQGDTTRDQIKQAILQRTTRGLLTYNTGKVHRLEGEIWAVPSTRGGFHQVHLDEETCDCEDFTFYGSAVGVACRHIYAAAIARARGRDLDLRDHGHGCALCMSSGFVFFGVEEDGQERDEAVPCRRCRPEAGETG
jgi:SWIM zinc finger